MTRDDFFQQAMLKMAEVILLRTDKEPTPEQLAKKAASYAEALHNEMLAGLTRCDIREMTSEAPPDEKVPVSAETPVLAPVRLRHAPVADGPTCPNCQSPMKRREGRYGPFWGCTGFPQCKTIMKIDQTSGST